MEKVKNILCLITCICFYAGCSPKVADSSGKTENPPVRTDVEVWLTKGDSSARMEKQTSVLKFSTATSNIPVIQVDSAQVLQTIDGFGYTLTGGSAHVINKLSASARTALLKELFSNDEGSIGVSYLRISIGASDLNESVFSYDDMPAGQTDETLANFTLSPDKADLIPLLKEILVINPGMKILGSPWSPPVWMKDNASSKGGSLLPQYYDAYARYFVKYIQQMKA